VFDIAVVMAWMFRNSYDSLLGYDEFLGSFALLKGKDKLAAQDAICTVRRVQPRALAHPARPCASTRICCGRA